MATSSPSSQSQITITIHALLFFFSFISPSSTYSSPQTSRISYSKYCNSVVPKSTSQSSLITNSTFPQLKTGYFNGGDRLLAQNLIFPNNSPTFLVFRSQGVYNTEVDDIHAVHLSLILRFGNGIPVLTNSTVVGQSKPGRFRTRRPRFPIRRNRVSFTFDGFWSESRGKLCMVGVGRGYSKEGNFLDLSAVFKLSYPKNSTILTSFVTGGLESVDSSDNENYFEPITVFVFSQRHYEYTLIPNKNVFPEGSGFQKESALSLEKGGICSNLLRYSMYQMEYGSNCFATKNCTPLGNGFLPASMMFSDLQCSENKGVRLLIGFYETSRPVYNQPVVIDRMLVGEGVWDGDDKLLRIAACRILDYNGSLINASVGDCSVRLSIWFPAVVSIKSRRRVAGLLWSNKTVNESGYFEKIEFQQNGVTVVPGMKYEYTEIEKVMKSCPMKPASKKGRRYPSGHSYDMKFEMRIINKRGRSAWGYFTPLTVGDQFFEHSRQFMETAMTPETSVRMKENSSHLLNVSYDIHIAPDYRSGVLRSSNVSSDLNAPFGISAEGIYNSETGNLCMVGCRRVKLSNIHTTDCEILINVQFRSLNSKSSEYVTGTIKSRRASTDPLHFENLQLSAISLSRTQAQESVWRMDLEITMVLISNTLICIFVGLQIFYVKKHPDVLPSISLVMLVILTLGQMIPLVLNFEAMFVANHNRQNVMMGSGGWLEVNEVLVRVVTMVSFLLQFRLLQLSWSSRLGDGNQKGLVLAEKKAIYVLLPLYLVGAFIAWGMHWWNNYHSDHFRHRLIAVQMHSLWGDLRSYGGLLLDGFLLPQILFNLFWNSKDKALFPAFYVGITSVRVLPHAYDLYRTYRYVPYLDAAYIYANPRGDFFSTAWDVIIPCGGLLFALFIYLQQRFGGCCFLPHRFRQSPAYEKVPVANGE